MRGVAGGIELVDDLLEATGLPISAFDVAGAALATAGIDELPELPAGGKVWPRRSKEAGCPLAG